MIETPLVRNDEGLVNARILAREAKSDYRRVESASVKMNTNLKSAEGKRLFVRYFTSVQLATHFIFVIARTKLLQKDIQQVESLVKRRLESIDVQLNQAIDSLELLFKTNGINRYATYDTKPLVLEVGVISSTGMRFFELMHKFDDIMPLFQTLEIFGVITSTEADTQRSKLHRSIRKFVQVARNLKIEFERRMHSMPTLAEIQATAAQRRNTRATDLNTDEAARPESGIGELRAKGVGMPESAQPDRPMESAEASLSDISGDPALLT